MTDVENLLLREVVARQRILETFARYAIGMDRGDRALFEDVWTPDAVWVCEELDLDLHGRDAILAFYDSRYASAPALPAAGGNVRFGGNHVFAFEEDHADVVSEMAAFRYTGSEVYPYTIGFYEDRVVSSGNTWRIQSRTMIVTPIARPSAGNTR